MSDLVSGVLTRISAIEKEALSISAGRFVEGMAGRRVDPDLNRYLDTICDPDEVLRLCRAHRRIVERVTALKHHVVEGDCWFTCAAATEEQDGGDTCRDDAGDECECGRDALVDALLRDLAVGLGVVEETASDS